MKCQECKARCHIGTVNGKPCHPAPSRVSIKGKTRNFGIFAIEDKARALASVKKMYPSQPLTIKDLP